MSEPDRHPLRAGLSALVGTYVAPRITFAALAEAPIVAFPMAGGMLVVLLLATKAPTTALMPFMAIVMVMAMLGLLCVGAWLLRVIAGLFGDDAPFPAVLSVVAFATLAPQLLGALWFVVLQPMVSAGLADQSAIGMHNPVGVAVSLWRMVLVALGATILFPRAGRKVAVVVVILWMLVQSGEWWLGRHVRRDTMVAPGVSVAVARTAAPRR